LKNAWAYFNAGVVPSCKFKNCWIGSWCQSIIQKYNCHFGPQGLILVFLEISAVKFSTVIFHSGWKFHLIFGRTNPGEKRCYFLPFISP
jgi:hypothetical protein